ncbi:MAG: hypothetical protein ACLFPE_05440 [Bacteroidales bacterium]
MKQINTNTRQTGCMRFLKSFPYLILLLLISFPEYISAQGNLLVTPRRVVFEGNQSSQEINLANTGQDSATYAISFVQYRMTDDGRFEQIEEPDPGQKFADKMIRYFPRTVNLGPGEAQMVRMQLRRSSNIESGEYRSHMYFRAVPKETALGEEELLDDTTTIGIRLTPIFGITIPVIVRQGDPQATVTIDQLKVEPVNDSIHNLEMVFIRNGEKSVYGDLTVEYVSPGGDAIPVGMVRGIAVYTPNTSRKFQMDLEIPSSVNLKEGVLVVKFTNAEETGKSILAEKTLVLN